jgi:drug/metabolite transporter (DMT)-like permease
MVPVSQAITGVKLKPQLWLAVAMALTGVGLLTFDGAMNIGDARLHDLIQGDLYCVLAAMFYACYDVRVNTWSKKAATVPLTLYKTGVQALWSCITLTVLIVSGMSQGEQILDWISNVNKEELILICQVAVFSGAFANCLATILQVGAQRDVGPSRAQLIYSTNPLWNSLIATFSLGETIRTTGIAGAGLFLSALAIAAITPPEPEEPVMSLPETNSE